eukprot:CAMPEP_0174855262 /NCGR_PEP_ID=MMETSP1114-20130205/32860_1 /TAXON_ID=312471 /ORGANISM="Neobodo designis, Strain CCAP 1951/1" /LENGTH=182 /DNA_ID=CAMNT_0016089997 /DNA_START=46 /DNA_END=594 /DNA_ORIENTATION=-
MTLRVNDLDEAMRVARVMCSRHPDVLRTVGATNSARDAALKIFMREVATENSRAFDETELNESSIPRMADREGVSPSPPRANASQGGDGAAAAAGQSSSFQGVNSNPVPDEHGRVCSYCDTPSTRFCKETGRRHESGEERSLRLWRHMYRQLHVASNLISTARLEKKNTCVEDYAVDLDLDL